MDELNRYGLAEHRYEGVGELRHPNDNPTPVFFDVRQLNNAAIVIGCVATSGSLFEDPSELAGQTLDGQHLQTFGRLVRVRLHLANELRTAVYLCSEFRVGPSGFAYSSYEPIRFALYN